MVPINRSLQNPILKPNKENRWEAVGAFNGCIVKDNKNYHILYRALSGTEPHFGVNLNLSTIGCADSSDGINFTNRRLLVKPDYEWEKFGCEDPRVTKINNKFYIFYTALSSFPFTPEDIKIGLAVTSDFQKIEEKHLVTPFNSKAMALFPETIDGKLVAFVTANTDRPPAKICLAFFAAEKDLWSKEYWQKWYNNLDNFSLPLQRSANDHIEAGAPPVKTKYGWLLIYSYIKNYFSGTRVFGIEAVLLNLRNPLKIIGRTKEPLLVPETVYELYGNVPNIVFPSGALIANRDLSIYYGASDTSCCLATLKLNDLLGEVLSEIHLTLLENKVGLERFKGNPLISPNPDHHWETQCTFNPAAIYEDNKVHLLYRAMDDDNTSVFGYASSHDGLHLDERLDKPVYIPRESFEKKIQPGNSGCEDPRLTRLEDKIYMCYTAYDGLNATRVTLTSINLQDFTNKHWHWSKPEIISPPGIDDKNACLLPEKINNQYVILHRINPCVWIDFLDELKFGDNHWIKGDVLLTPREEKWDSLKVGIGPPPIKTPDGWLLIYHGLSTEDKKYRLGAALLDLNNPAKVIVRLDYPILEPLTPYENSGVRPGTVFANGAVVLNNEIFVYYGGADQVVCVATINLNKLLNELKESYNLQMILKHSIL